jgi:hypothetical protein
MKICLFSILLGIIFSNMAQAQEDILKRRVSISANEFPLDEFLLLMAEKGAFSISFSSAAVPKSQKVNGDFKDITVKDITSQLLPEAELRVTDNHLVILKSIKRKQEAKQEKFTVSGRVFDSRKMEPVLSAVVFDVSGLSSVITDDNGNFSLTFPNRFDRLIIGIAKASYLDTLIILKPEDQNIRVFLKRKEEKSITLTNDGKPDVNSMPSTFGQGVVSAKLSIRSQNISGFISRPIQVALTPKLNSNGKMAGSVRNMFSFNLLGSYGHGVGMAQFGGYAINRYNVSGVQGSIAGNFTGGNVGGVQLAGGINRTKGTQKGLQASLLQNKVGEDLKGFQLTGIQNKVSGNVKGFQAALISNHAEKRIKGGQLAGVLNTGSDTTDIQASGIANFTYWNKTLQLAGLFNSAKTGSKGIQIAPVNITDELTGLQLIGLLNKAGLNDRGLQVGIVNVNKNNRGKQIGLINFADSLSVDAKQIGLLSFANQGGFVQYEFSATELLWANAAAKIGNRKFYNILTLGMGAGRFAWGFGYGFGWYLPSSKDGNITPEFTIQWLTDSQEPKNNYLLFRNAWMYHFPRKKDFGLSIGPSINLMMSGVGGNLPPEQTIAPYSLISFNLSNVFVEGWVGIKAAIQF